MEFGIRLTDEEFKLLQQFMKENNIKTKSKAIKQCIRIASDKTEINAIIYDLLIKTNKLIHYNFILKKLVEQFFVNTGFAKNIDIETDDCLKEFYELNNIYKNKIID